MYKNTRKTGGIRRRELANDVNFEMGFERKEGWCSF